MNKSNRLFLAVSLATALAIAAPTTIPAAATDLTDFVKGNAMQTFPRKDGGKTYFLDTKKIMIPNGFDEAFVSYTESLDAKKDVLSVGLYQHDLAGVWHLTYLVDLEADRTLDKAYHADGETPVAAYETLMKTGKSATPTDMEKTFFSSVLDRLWR
jgi:hypothetical protein